MTERRGLTQITNFPRTFGQIRGIPVAAGPAAVLLLHLDDDMTGGTVVDSSPSAHVCTRNSVTKQDPGQFGTAGDFGTVHNTLRNISVADSTDFDFGIDDFTIECFINFTLLPNEGGGSPMHMLAKDLSGQRSWGFLWENTKTLNFDYSINGTSITRVSSAILAPVVSTWYHMAVTREANVVRLFFNGTKVKESNEGSQDYQATTNDVFVGMREFVSFESAFTGDIDEVRIVKGTAIYTADYTPPTAPF